MDLGCYTYPRWNPQLIQSVYDAKGHSRRALISITVIVKQTHAEETVEAASVAEAAPAAENKTAEPKTQPELADMEMSRKKMEGSRRLYVLLGARISPYYLSSFALLD